MSLFFLFLILFNLKEGLCAESSYLKSRDRGEIQAKPEDIQDIWGPKARDPGESKKHDKKFLELLRQYLISHPDKSLEDLGPEDFAVIAGGLKNYFTQKIPGLPRNSISVLYLSKRLDAIKTFNEEEEKTLIYGLIKQGFLTHEGTEIPNQSLDEVCKILSTDWDSYLENVSSSTQSPYRDSSLISSLIKSRYVLMKEKNRVLDIAKGLKDKFKKENNVQKSHSTDGIQEWDKIEKEMIRFYGHETGQ